jgi:hypothetical protein
MSQRRVATFNVMFACTISTAGAHPCVFLQGWAAMLLELFHWLRRASQPNHLRRHFRLLPLRQAQGRLFAKNPKDGARHVADASEIRSLGRPVRSD